MNCFRSNAALLIAVCCWCLAFAIPEPARAQTEQAPADMPLQGAKVITLKRLMADANAVTTVTVKPGTTVIWLNDTSRVLELEFTGKQVTMACGSPVGFFVNEEGSYTSQKIIPKAVVSLCFIEPGEFSYQLLLGKLKGPDPLQGKNFKGTIIVE
jgi:plastocyanin